MRMTRTADTLVEGSGVSDNWKKNDMYNRLAMYDAALLTVSILHCKAFGGTLDDVECMKLTGLARNTYYKYKRQIREEAKTQG